MIVSQRPRLAQLARHIARPLLLLFLWDVAITLFYVRFPTNLRPLELPLSLFGTAIALFLGIAVNSAYARWWEARGLCGALANAARSLARQALTFSREAEGTRPEVARELVRTEIAYLHVLRATLRGTPVPPEADTYLSDERRAALEGFLNKPTALLTVLSGLSGAMGVDLVARVRMETTLVDLTNAQGGLERIKGTPMPSQYRLFPALFARLFCLLLPFAVVADLRLFTPVGSALVSLMFLMALQIGRDLMDPFAGDIHDVPLDAICRAVEIDIQQMLGEPAPEKIAPVDGVLW